MRATTAFWAGPDGDAYLKRNRVDWRARVPFWRDVLDRTSARSVCEVGTNAGWNLSAIKKCEGQTMAYGCEVNPTAHAQAVKAGLRVALLDGKNYLKKATSEYDLVFTAGVLIHVAPHDLKGMMQAIVNASADFVLAVEYAADKEEEVEYRGRPEMLWKRPYGQLYIDMGLKPVANWKAEGFDNCHAWLLRK